MKLRKFDVVKVTDPNHTAYGKEIHILMKDTSIDGYGCKLDEHYTCYVKSSQIEFVKRPKRNEVPNYVLNYLEA